MREFVALAVTTVLILTAVMVLIAMAGCASMGFFQMSDEWCQQHPNASAERCSGRHA